MIHLQKAFKGEIFEQFLQPYSYRMQMKTRTQYLAL